MYLTLPPTTRHRGGYFPVSKPIQLVEQLAIRCSKGATRQARLDGFGYTRIIGLTRRSLYQKRSFVLHPRAHRKISASVRSAAFILNTQAEPDNGGRTRKL